MNSSPRFSRWFANERVGFACWLGLLLAVAYGGAIRAPFVFDDFAAVVENPTIKDLTDLRAVLSPPENTGVSGRPVVNLTLAVNHALGGLEPSGYHLFNVIVHAATALLLYGVLRRTLKEPALAQAATLLWAVHPLLTESVTCVVQRNEVIVGFFYLLTIYAVVRSSATAGPPRRWEFLAVVACWLGMASKEVMVSAPLVALLYDRTFIAGTFRAAWKQRGRLYAGLASGWLLLAWLVARSDHRGGTVGFGLGVRGWEYLLTQCRALVLYLKLSFWPYPLVLDYGTGVETRLAAVWPQATLLISLVVATAFVLRRASAIGFGGACFFAILAPSSSVVPLATQTVAEHRFYLPLAVVITMVVAAIRQQFGPRSHWFWLGAVGACVALTMARNRDYRSELVLWSDTVAKAPANARAHNNLGLALFHAGHREEARERYAEALRLDPSYAPAHANLGDVLVAEGRTPEAISAYDRALRFAPGLAAVRAKLVRQRHAQAIHLLKTGEVEQALTQFELALGMAPDDAEIRHNFGAALLAKGKWAEARREFEHALRLQPDYAKARTSLERLQALESGRSAVP